MSLRGWWFSHMMRWEFGEGWKAGRSHESRWIKWPKCIDSSFGAEQSSMRRLPSDLNPRIVHGHAEIQWVPWDTSCQISKMLANLRWRDFLKAFAFESNGKSVSQTKPCEKFVSTDLGKRQAASQKPWSFTKEFLGQSCSGSFCGEAESPILSVSWLMTVMTN